MSAKIIRMIPPEERPYEWARKEMEKYFPNPDRFRLTNLDKRADEPNTQVSLFRKGAEYGRLPAGRQRGTSRRGSRRDNAAHALDGVQPHG